MTAAGSVQRIVAALIVLMTTAIVARAEEVNDYPTAARVEYVFGCLKANDEAGDRTMLLFNRRDRIALAL